VVGFWCRCAFEILVVEMRMSFLKWLGWVIVVLVVMNLFIELLITM